METTLDAVARKHFQKRAVETRALAEFPAFKGCRDSLLKLAQRYEALADPGEHHQPRPAFHARVRLIRRIKST